MANRQFAMNFSYVPFMTYCQKLNDRKRNILCKKCNTFKSSEKIRLESHLFHKHKIFTKEGNLIWGDESSIVERYFTQGANKYFARCNVCGSVHPVTSKYNLLRHLEKNDEIHKNTLDVIRKEIEDSWVSRHFRITESLEKAQCKFKRCKFSSRIVNGVNPLKSHLENHQIHSESGTIQQPVAEEMAAQHIKYCESIMDNCKRIKRKLICKKCKKKPGDKIGTEAHLFHKHKIFTTQSNFVWEDSIIKRYFTTTLPERKYFAECKVANCTFSGKITTKEALRKHLMTHKTVLKDMKEEIKNSWVADYCKFNPSWRVWCTFKQCKFKWKTVLGINGIEKHLENKHGIRKPSEFGRGTRSYNVDATTQQPVAEGSDASTSSHRDNRHRQEDQQRLEDDIETDLDLDSNFGSETSLSDLLQSFESKDALPQMKFLRGVIQEQSEMETIIEQTLQRPEQETEIASDFDIGDAAAEFDRHQPINEPESCSAKSVDDENVKTRKRKFDLTEQSSEEESIIDLEYDWKPKKLLK